MKNLDDPTPLWQAAKAGSALERSLSAARDRGPTGAQLRDLERNVLAAVGAVTAAGVAVAVAAPAAKASIASPVAVAGLSATKLAVVLLVAAAASGTAAGLYWKRAPASLTPPARSSAPSPAASPSTGSPAAPAPAVVVSPPSVPAPTSGLAPGEPAPRASERPAPRPAAPRRRVREASAAVETPRSGAALDELQLLSRARRALATDPALALTLIDQHERRFASGAMDQEREVIAIDALVRLGRLPDARGRAQRFAREHAGSVYLGRMQAILSPAAGPP